MENPLNTNRDNGCAHKRGKQDSTEGVADGLAKTAFKGLRIKLSIGRG